jgi:glutamate/tyrosine decarboxylase-like PLP-dependent enzyme
MRVVPKQPGREAVDVDALAQAPAELNGASAIVVANAGTVNTVDFDDIAAIGALKERFTAERVADAASAGGETFLTPTVLDGVPALRAAFGNWRTTDADVDRVFAALKAACG